MLQRLGTKTRNYTARQRAVTVTVAGWDASRGSSAIARRFRDVR